MNKYYLITSIAIIIFVSVLVLLVAPSLQVNPLQNANFIEVTDPCDYKCKTERELAGFTCTEKGVEDYMCKTKYTNSTVHHIFAHPIEYGEFYVLSENQTYKHRYLNSFEPISDDEITLKLVNTDGMQEPFFLPLKINDVFVGGCHAAENRTLLYIYRLDDLFEDNSSMYAEFYKRIAEIDEHYECNFPQIVIDSMQIDFKIDE